MTLDDANKWLVALANLGVLDAVAAKHPNMALEQYRTMLEGVRKLRSVGAES
jgi:hypothetical protein